ncbi:MAG: hypothetical protein ACI9LY_003503 [Arenicella sp.]|jgi:hypothetical protein
MSNKHSAVALLPKKRECYSECRSAGNVPFNAPLPPINTVNLANQLLSAKNGYQK